MKILMIDNYDSFTFNLVQYLAELGAELEVVRNDDITSDEVLAQDPDGIVLSPGPGRPENAGVLEDLVRAVAGKIPTLGVCLGHQAIAQVFGGKIGYAPTLMHGKVSQVEHDRSKLFKKIESPFTATRYHSLIVERNSLPREFKVTAWADKSIIMAIQHRKLPLYGVQFHPESILTRCGHQLLNNFLESI